MILYRAVGLQELELIYDSNMRAFPARLPQQPIFYPVLDLEYARQTASDWNTKRAQFAGYVTQFKVDDEYIDQFETHTVGKSEHQELWIPAEEMEEFNQHILGHIKVLEAYFGGKFQGFVPEAFGLQGKNAVEQFTLLANSYVYKRMEFYLEIKRNHKAVFLNYPFWQKHEFKNPGLQAKVVQAIKESWLTSFPQIPLVTTVPENVTPLKPANSEALAEPVQEKIRPVKPRESKSWGKPPEEDVTTVKRANLPSRPLAAPKDIKPARPRNVQPLLPAVPEDAAPVQPADSHASVGPGQEEVTFSGQTDSGTLDDLVDEDATSVKPTDSESFIGLDDEEVAPAEQAGSESFVDLIDEEAISGKPTDSESFVDLDLDDEDDALIESTDSRSSVHAVHEDTAPAISANSQSFTRPVPDPVRPIKPTVSHFSQGLESGLQGQFHEAIDELTRAVAEDPHDAVARTSLGVAFHRLGEDDRALACYEAALKIDPNDAEAHYFRANILYRQGNVREAIAGYTIAIGLKPELIEAHQKSVPQDRLTDYTPAPAEMHRIARPADRILALNQALETNPRQANLFKERAAEYSRLENYEQAIADYNSSLALQPNDANALHLRGVAYQQLGQLDRARQDYERVSEIDPQLANVYLQRGVTFGQTGHFRQSIASLTEGLRLSPNNPDGYFNRGASYVQLGDFESAIQDFSTVLQLSPNDEAAYYWRGLSHEAAGRRDEAIRDYQHFLALSKDESTRAEIEQKLSQWKVRPRNGGSRRSAVLDDKQKTNQIPSEGFDQRLDLYELIVALGERALRSTWLASGVECLGESAEELYALTDQNGQIQGRDLLDITSGIRQTMRGDFQAFDPDAASPWLFLRAWDGNGFYIETNDPKSRQRLKAQFPSAEDVEGATPPYESLFIHI